MTTTDIAKILVLVSKRFGDALSDIQIEHNWDDLTSREKNAAISFVENIYNCGKNNPEDWHNSLIENMVKDGWTYGEKYDEINKKSYDIQYFKDLHKNTQSIYSLYFDISISLKPFLKD